MITLKPWQEICPVCNEHPKHRQAKKCRACSTGEGHYAWKGSGALPTTKRARAQRRFPVLECERCGLTGRDRHHKDGDTGNNDPENIEILCRSCHMKVDGRLEQLVLHAQEWRKRLAKEVTHCIHGHEFTPENTYHRPDWPTSRGCRQCRNAAERRRKLKLRGAHE